MVSGALILTLLYSNIARKEGIDLTEEDYVVARDKQQTFQNFVQSTCGKHTYMLTPFLFGEPETRDIYRLP